MNSEVALAALLQKIEYLASRVECHCCKEAPGDQHDDDCYFAEVGIISSLAKIIERRANEE